LPETLDETYQRTLEDIGSAKWEYAHRLFQCITVASRPFRVNELAEFLVFDFDAGEIPKPIKGWRAEDPVGIVRSTCSSLVAVVKADDSEVVQFSHFSVKEFLMSSRILMEKHTISRYHVRLTPAHTMVVQACLGTLLHLEEDVSEDNLKDFPLAEYAAEHWVDHAQFDNISLAMQDSVKLLFDPNEPHFAVWVWLFDSDGLFMGLDARQHWQRSESLSQPPGTPLHFAALYGMCDVVEFLVVDRAQDVKARRCSDNLTPLLIASARGHTEFTRILLDRGADANDQDKDGRTSLHLASGGGHVKIAQNLLGHEANAYSRDIGNLIPSHLAPQSRYMKIAELLVKHDADVNAQDNNRITPLHLASGGEHLDVVLFLIHHGADASACTKDNKTPLHMALQIKHR
jgi:hypothetical protein